MEFKPSSLISTPTEKFIKTCSLQRFYEVERYDVGRTITVNVQSSNEKLEHYQFPYTNQGLELAKNFAFNLYKKTANRELHSHQNTFSSRKDKLIHFMVMHLGYKPEYKKTINDVEQRIEKAKEKTALNKEVFVKEKLIIKELPENLELNKLRQIGEKIYLLEVGRLLEDEGIEITELEIDNILVYSNLENKKSGRPDFKVVYSLDRFTFNLEVEYKNCPDRILHSYINQALFFTREAAEKERTRIINNLKKYL